MSVGVSNEPARILDEFEKNHGRVFWGDRMMTLDKSAGFLQDERFREAYDSIRGSHIYDQYDSPHTIAWRLHTLVWAAQNALKLDGDFVECGVFKGDMSWVVTQLINFAELERTFYLYDTFAGFSADYSSADDFPDNPGFLDFAQNVYSDESIYPSVVKRFENMSNVRVIRGVIPDALFETAPSRIAYLHVDLNSPRAELGCLEMLFDRLVSGAALVLDDYGWHQFRRQKEAEDQFFADRGYSVLELPTGQGLVVKR
ncbi:MAG TPA: TylF/MycF/NovP-related O-methyltransferase [Candidatus Obscuribacterales bacterium]